MATTKETKPMFVYWGGVEFGELDDGTEKATVEWYSQEAMDTYHPVPKYPSGRSSSKLGHDEVLESLRECEELDQFAPVTLTVEKGNANKHPKAKEPFYWNLVAVEVGHNSEYWPDGAPEETQAPAPKVVQPAPVDDMDELDDYINKQSDDHGQYQMNDSDMKEFGAQLGNAANTASRIYSAYIISSEKSVEFNEDRFAELIVKNFKGIAKAKQTILNERSAR
jgi:hypothetical protein